jgi:hypothetical protein
MAIVNQVPVSYPPKNRALKEIISFKPPQGDNL